VHGAVIGAEALIGNGATVQDGARIGARCLVGAGATIPPNTVVPDGQLVLDTVARVKGPLSASAQVWVDTNPEVYQELARRHRRSVVPVVPSATEV
jgi:carbonic anhydrase/acetyltransferase-like protein (isoleucine patch superfamily)